MARSKNKKDTFVFRDEWLDWIVDEDYEWSGEECKELLLAIRAYRKGEPIPKASSRSMNIVINECISSISDSDAAYKEKCEANRRRVAARWENYRSQSDTNVYGGIPTYKNSYQRIHDNDNDYDSDNDNENELKENNEKKSSEETSLFDATDNDGHKEDESKTEEFDKEITCSEPSIEFVEEDKAETDEPLHTETDASGLPSFRDAKIGELCNISGRIAIKRSAAKTFTIPTIDEIQQYITFKNYSVNAKLFYDYYNEASPPWTYLKGSKRVNVSSWKQCLATFEMHSSKKTISNNTSKGYETLKPNEYEQI